MNLFKQGKLRILAYSIILVLLLLPGITLAEQALKTVYQKMVTSETNQDTDEPQDANEPIIADTASTIEQALNNQEQDVSVESQALFGNRLAYVDMNTKELVCYNLKTKTNISISKTPNPKEYLVMNKDKLVWTELNELWAYDFTDNSKVKVSDRPGDLSDIYKDLLVYRGVEQPGIYLYDFKTKKTVTISKANAFYTAPTIWKDIITWFDNSDGNNNVYYHDLKENKTVKITNFTEERFIGNPIATKKSIVYPLVDEAGIRQLMEYDLKSGDTITIPSLPSGSRFRVEVDKFKGDKINYRTGNHETVMIDLNTKQVEVFPTTENKTVYGGVIIGTENNKPEFKVQRN